MATDAENIATIKSNALARLAEITAAKKPSYTENGRSVSWAEYHKILSDQVAWCDQQLAAIEPFEVITYGY
jgi:hypothetical protein